MSVTNRIWTRVTLDGPDYRAKVDPTNRWNGWLSPYFTLDTVRELAKWFDQQAEEYGLDAVDTIHVIDGGTTEDGSPRVVVAKVSWMYIGDEGPEECTEIIEPTSEGLYGIGGWEWCWYEKSWWCVDCDGGTDWHETHCDECGQHRRDCEMPADDKAQQYQAKQAAEQAAKEALEEAARKAVEQAAATAPIRTRVCIDTDVVTAEAVVDPGYRRNGYVHPRFTLDASRKLSADLAALNEQYGAGTFDTVHVLDEGDQAVVMVVGWQHLDPARPERFVEIVARDEDGLYAIGGGGWTWCIETRECPCGAFPEHHETECPKCGAPRPDGKRTHCSKGHHLDTANTYEHKGRRTCRACRRERDRVRRAAKRPATSAA
ncbi:hypothetical protein [Kitasatospora sp. NPDC058046]|uniref:hypothetical protein n=1 Tax=Kitasatospora sp. NPDC058046 TaxID=3346312 RepID=UPI0036DB5B3D